MNTELLDWIDGEIASEIAVTLGRSGKRLEDALSVLRDLPHHDPAYPDALVTAADALWSYVVVREAVGLRDDSHFRQSYVIPREVWSRMAPKISRQSGDD
jgi:hypothetical protein